MLSMASSSTSSVQKSFKYDVFLSFRGEDTRKNFVDHLYYALQQKSIHTFKDDEKIKKGERISDELIKSIEDSRFYIIVFSKTYASSSWCLDELVKIMECQKTTEHTAYPIFYDVEPSIVRKQSGEFGKAFAAHEQDEAAHKWREALKEAADLAGWELKKTVDGHEAKFIQKIVKDISLKLRSINFNVDGKLIGMESRMKDVVSSLEIGFDDVRVIGIKGIGGGGKTTLARSVFDQISFWFEGKSFVENVKEVSKASMFGLKSLQKQILSDVLNDQGITVSSVYDGKNMMKTMMCDIKVLVVLDDVDHIDQLKALAGELNWFKKGSRVIITTRDEQVLVAHRVKLIHDVNLLSKKEAICLFSRHAFGREVPIQGYKELSLKVVGYAAGLPLTITVLGSFLCGKNKFEWKDALERLKTIPLKETLEKLELSYIGLEEDYKEIFLDVACMLKGWTKDRAIKVLESCGFHARNGLRVLEQKSLITISDKNCLWMHDHIQEMGRNIVRHLHPNEPNKHSRLWYTEEIKDILANDLGTEATRCVKLDMMELNREIVMKGLQNMKNLRFLHVSSRNFHSDWNFDEISHYFPNALRYLSWNNDHFESLHRSFQVYTHGALQMGWSRILQLLEGGERKVLQLRFLELSHIKLRTLDLRVAPNIETLSLHNCFDLVELSLPPACLNLRSLDLNCSKFMRTLDLRGALNLKTLSLRGCYNLVNLHIPSECVKLKSINIEYSNLRTFDLGWTPKLKTLSLTKCHRLIEVHTRVGCLKNVDYLDLSGCLGYKSFFFKKGFESLEVSSLSELHLIAKSLDICRLHCDINLPKLRFTCLYEEHGPSLIYMFIENLISLGMFACTNLVTSSEIICALRCLKKLTLEGSIPVVPKDLDQFEGLQELRLLSPKIKHLPDSICMLKHLKCLELNPCWLLEKLPEDLGQLECLEKLILSKCVLLRDIPDSICKMKQLKYFHLPYCVGVEKLPEEFGRLKCLKELNIEGTGIRHLPRSIFVLKGVRIVGFRWILQSCGFRSEIQTSEDETFCYVEL